MPMAEEEALLDQHLVAAEAGAAGHMGLATMPPGQRQGTAPRWVASAGEALLVLFPTRVGLQPVVAAGAAR